MVSYVNVPTALDEGFAAAAAAGTVLMADSSMDINSN